ncbi:MAG: RDD family protein [Roseiarcus sp.]
MSQAVSYTVLGRSADRLAGVRTRRLAAWMLDAIIVALLTGMIWLALLIGTLGLSLLLLPPLFPTIAVIYHGLTVSGAGRATLGMRALGLEVADFGSGGRPTFVQAAAQAILFYVSWAFPLLFVVTLVDGDKRYLHDMLSGLVLLRRA